ncbi:MAG: hypothetical protein V4696_03735 [Pseudomonadota bacterium]
MLIEPLDTETGARIQIRVGRSQNTRTLLADALKWHSAILRSPAIVMDLMDEEFRGKLQIGRASGVLQTKLLSGYTAKELERLVWKGAPVKIWSGDGALTSDLREEFVGQVTGGVIDKASRQLPLTMEVNRKLFDVPLLNLEYGGGGGVDGAVEMRGQLKPAAFGSPINVPVIFFDPVNNIGQVDAYGNCTAISALYEDAASFGTKQGDYASYAALLAATLAEGQWATCVAQGMIRLGAEPRGLITTDPVCGAGTPGAMMLRWLQTHAGVSAGNIDSSTFTTLDSTLATLLGHAAAVNFWTGSQRGVLDLMQTMCGSVNSAPLIRPDGKIAVSRQVNAGAVALTIDRFGGNPTITAWKPMERPNIYWRLKSSAARTWVVHSLDEIDFNDDLIDLGDYVPGTEYRQGNIVRQATDGNRYVYINASPTSIYPPPDLTYWELHEEGPDATVIGYADGTPIEYLKPAAPNSTRNVNRGAWTAGQVYVVGDNFSFGGSSYSVTTGHTSAGVAPDFTKATLLAAVGNRTKIAWIRSATVPATPTGSAPAGWSLLGIPTGNLPLYASTAEFQGTTLIGVWTTPEPITFGAAEDYNAATAYVPGQQVLFGGGTYIALVATTGNAPTGTNQANAYWGVGAAPGGAGAPGTPPSAFGPTNINLTSGAAKNLYDAAVAAGYTGASDATITFKVPNGVVIRGLSGAPAGYGIDTGVWPTGYSLALTLIVESGGIVDGGGGQGGAGGSFSTGGPGGKGGDAIFLRVDMSGGITINSGGIVRGGGGGGGGGGAGTDDFAGELISKAGGGGGGGSPNGAAGVGGTGESGSATNGNVGTTSAGGTGGNGQAGGGGAGRAGGTFAVAGTTGFSGSGDGSPNYSGGTGGAVGKAVNKNGKTATVTNNGTMTGAAS